MGLACLHLCPQSPGHLEGYEPTALISLLLSWNLGLSGVVGLVGTCLIWSDSWFSPASSNSHFRSICLAESRGEVSCCGQDRKAQSILQALGEAQVPAGFLRPARLKWAGTSPNSGIASSLLMYFCHNFTCGLASLLWFNDASFSCMSSPFLEPSLTTVSAVTTGLLFAFPC